MGGFTSYRGNSSGMQQPSRFRVLLYLFIFFTVLIFMFAVLSQPLAIIGDILSDSYPTGSEFNEGRDANSGIQTFVLLALGAAVVIGVIFLFAFYAYRNLGGGGRDSFG